MPTKSLSAREAKNAFGRLLDDAQSTPITIEKHGRPVAIVLSIQEYCRLESLEDAYWSTQADNVLAKGDWAGAPQSAQVLQTILSADG